MRAVERRGQVDDEHSAGGAERRRPPAIMPKLVTGLQLDLAHAQKSSVEDRRGHAPDEAE